MLRLNLKRILINLVIKASGLLLVAFAVGYVIALFSFHLDDPSFNTATTDGYVSNWLGSFGSYLSDLSFQFVGVAAFFLALIIFSLGLKLMSLARIRNIWFKLILIPPCLLSFAISFAKIPTPSWWDFVSLGGVNGKFILSEITFVPQLVTAFMMLLVGIILISIIVEVSLADWIYFLRYSFITTKIIGEKTYNKLAAMREKSKQARLAVAENSYPNKPALTAASPKPNLAPISDDEIDELADELIIEDDAEEDLAIEEIEEESYQKIRQQTKKEISKIKAKNNKSKYELPTSALLVDRSAENKDKKVDPQLVEKQSQLLLRTLEDFGVNGTSLGSKIGPVITLHEFEPAAGTKASRVIGLSDDIARSMSAVSARISVIPGRTSLGIELPNPKRQMIFLRELIENSEYRNSQFFLPMILGKNIGGEVIITDLAKMPHLLIAGTTGSGKSVGLNVMILSLLFRMRPDECKFIMIDPKMLELSIYDGIPHLLAPVVTEPGKAVIALKWVVTEMESRYRLMSSVNVRNILGYNEKIEKAIFSGETLKRRVQTGYDPNTSEPIFEDIEMEMKKLPFIVVIVDEMADLMLVAGKEIENSVQRLAQMARAAGIHIITATQRPSVDVITGVIKANFPTRISFQVTSKIDSRTILGVQGAEQLLGQGDMIYMYGGSKMMRVHGPFCSDAEIEKIVQFIKDQDTSEFNSSDKISFEVSDIEADTASGGELAGGEGDLYAKAVAIVRRDKKPSISYVQRQLRIGYNKAANLIEQMEREGVVSAPNVAGKREVLE